MQGSWTRVMKEDRLSNKPEHSSETGSPKPALPRLQTPKESDLLSPSGDRGSTALPRGHENPLLGGGPSRERGCCR